MENKDLKSFNTICSYSDDSSNISYFVNYNIELNVVYISMCFNIENEVTDMMIKKINDLDYSTQYGLFEISNNELIFKTSICFIQKPLRENIEGMVEIMKSRFKAVIMMLSVGENNG